VKPPKQPGLLRRIGRNLWSTYDGMPPEVLVLAAVAFCVALGFGIVIPVVTVFAESFGVTATMASGVISVFAAARLLATAPAGYLVNKFGEPVVLASGLAFVSLTSFFAGLSQSYWQLIVLRGLGGFGSVMFTVSSVALLLRVAPPHLRGRASSLWQGGFLIGGIVGPGFGGLLAFSLRAPFFVYSATLAIATVVTIIFLAKPSMAQANVDEPVVDEPVPVAGWRQLREALKDRAYITALMTSLANGFTTFGLRSALVPLFVVMALDASVGLTGLGFVVSASTSAAFLIPAGRMADLRGRKPALMLGSSLSLAGSILLAVWETRPGFLVAMALLGIGGAFWGASMPAIVGDITGGRRGGPLVATYQGVGDVGAIAGPLAAGALLDATGSFPLAFGIGALVVMLTVVLSVLMPETRNRHQQIDDEDQRPD
jgi:MFS transporter, DHA1 family, multidrug resistance protein